MTLENAPGLVAEGTDILVAGNTVFKSSDPEDTIAKIYTAGLLGEQYVGFDPGGSEDPLKQGSEIIMTQSALVLEEIVGQVLFSKAEENAKE